MRLTERYPFLYSGRVAQLRLARRLADAGSGCRFAERKAAEPLPVSCYRHGSLLRRNGTNYRENEIWRRTIDAPPTAPGTVAQ